MCFPEKIRLQVLKKADHTCCWCNNLQNKVEVHHIQPRAEKGPDAEDNAAPLCSNCHTLYGGNPDLRKEIKLRRDHWYETCQKRLEFAWSPSLYVPLLDSYEFNKAIIKKTTQGITVREDWPGFRFLSQSDNRGISPLQIMIGYTPDRPGEFKYPKLLSIRVEIPFGFSFNLGVYSESHWDSTGLAETLTKKRDVWMMKGLADRKSSIHPMFQQRDFFMLLRMEDGENRLLLRIFTPNESSIGIQTKLSDEVLTASSTYLEERGFTKKWTGPTSAPPDARTSKPNR
jgi:HNH endonuclease